MPKPARCSRCCPSLRQAAARRRRWSPRGCSRTSPPSSPAFRCCRSSPGCRASRSPSLPDAEAGARLGASHVLRGGLRRRGERLRITATLVETAGARQIWSDAFEAPAEGIFEVQDEIVARTAAILVARLEDRALADARRKPAESLAAWEVTLRGLPTAARGHAGGRRGGARLLRARYRDRPTLRPRPCRAVAVALQRMELPALGPVRGRTARRPMPTRMPRSRWTIATRWCTW